MTFDDELQREASLFLRDAIFDRTHTIREIKASFMDKIVTATELLNEKRDELSRWLNNRDAYNPRKFRVEVEAIEGDIIQLQRWIYVWGILYRTDESEFKGAWER